MGSGNETKLCVASCGMTFHEVEAPERLSGGLSIATNIPVVHTLLMRRLGGYSNHSLVLISPTWPSSSSVRVM